VNRHFSAEMLSVFIVGEVRRRKAAKISAHLPTCAQCSGVVRDLESVPTLLASTPAPPIPDSLSVRIELALRLESTTRVASEPGSEAARGQIPARQTPRRRWQLPRLSSPLGGSLAAAAAAVVIAGGGYALATHVSAPSSSSSSSSAVRGASNIPAAAAPAAVPRVAQRMRFGPAVVYRQAGQRDSIYSVETGTDYQPGTLSAQARTAVSAVSADNASYAERALANGGQPAAGVNLPRLEACVANIASGRNVLLVDVAEFQHKPATIIVVGSAPGAPGVAYAVGAMCSATSKDILDQQYMPSV
jgi:hypothetical protein